MNLSAYKIQWSIVWIENGILTKKILSLIKKTGYTSFGDNTLIRHSPNVEVAKQRLDDLIPILKSQGKTGKSAIITDQQFGMGVNNFQGVAEVKNLMKHMVIKSGNMTTTFPITQKQIDDIVLF